MYITPQNHGMLHDLLQWNGLGVVCIACNEKEGRNTKENRNIHIHSAECTGT
jgi:hypothetical protein